MSLQIEALSPIMWTIIIAVALVLIAAVVFTWKSSAMSTRKMVTIAMLTAVYVVLNFAGTVRLGWINISVASLPVIVGAMLLVTAALLAFAYYAKPRQKETISYRDALIIGLAQACAAMPGLSRSGSTIATGLLLGNKKAAVAQFSFLMVLAPILGETLLEAMSGDLTAGIATVPLAAGFLAAFVTGCLACKFMIEVVKRGKLIWFAVYCTVAGLVSIISYFC